MPVLGQHLVRQPHELGRTGSRLYAVNTIGAASGAFLAGFVLPPVLGFDRAYLLAMAVNVAVAGLAWRWSRIDEGGAAREPDVAADRPPRPARRGRVSRSRSPAATAAGAAGPAWAGSLGWLTAVAVLSGAFALGLEVLWTRMFAQVLQNSVYTFSTILVVFLAALAAGSAIAHRLCRVRTAPAQVLWALLTLSGLGVAATPFAFHRLTAGLSTLATGDAWISYIVSIFANAMLLLFVPAALLGSVFPYLLRASEGSPAAPGAVIGRLGALNTAGGVVGALAAGFVLLGTMGLWNGIRLMAAGYLLLALATAWRAWPTPRARLLPTAASVGALALLGTALDASRLPLVGVDAERGEALIATWEGPDGVVAVTERAGNRRLKMNNFYTLGGTGSLEQEQNQALLPLMTHPDPRTVFLLGLGTGITAGTALRHPVERLVVCEIAPDVIAAAAAYFNEPSGGLFPRPAGVGPRLRRPQPPAGHGGALRRDPRRSVHPLAGRRRQPLQPRALRSRARAADRRRALRPVVPALPGVAPRVRPGGAHDAERVRAGDALARQLQRGAPVRGVRRHDGGDHARPKGDWTKPLPR